jgi:[acyl-carrier-protein] S-malonyltransferase
MDHKVAFVFPGQGSQVVGMLSEFAATRASVLDTFAEASAVLGYDLWQLVQNGPEAQLNQTEFTQPALLAASIALWRLAREDGIAEPAMLAGHSLGEYSALVAAGVIDFADGIKLVQLRGQFMQTAVPLGEGSMAAVLGLDDAQVSAICSEITLNGGPDDVVKAANYNAPGQVVIAGKNAGLARAIEACKAAGAKRAMALSVSAPFHSVLMQPAAEKMAIELAVVDFRAPAIQIIQNVDADFCQHPDKIRENLVQQMTSAVRWTETIQLMAGAGVTRVVECGPGKVLAGLNKRIDKSLVSLSINSLASLAEGVEELSQ